MKILNVSVQNFCSFNSLTLDMSSIEGLTLLKGDTGVGKSTILDTIPWVLFGETSKGGKVDSVVSHGSKKATIGTVVLELPSAQVLRITRIRGTSSDLFYVLNDREYRGVSLVDTQKKINSLLGMDFNCFCQISYFSQFSDVESFFTCAPAERRKIFEQTANLEVPIKLGKLALQGKKEEKKVYLEKSGDLRYIKGKIEGLNNLGAYLANVLESKDKYSKELQAKINSYPSKSYLEDQIGILQVESDFLTTQVNSAKEEAYRQEADITISKKIIKEVEGSQASLPNASECPTCRSPLTAETKITINKDSNNNLSQLHLKLKEDILLLKQKQSNLMSIIQEDKALKTKLMSIKTDVDQLRILLNQQKTINNYSLDDISKLEEQKATLKKDEDKVTAEVRDSLDKIDLLERAHLLSVQLKGKLLSSTIANISSTMNSLLTEHFDAELKVSFEIIEGEEINLIIKKDNYECDFRSLSGGQRCVVKLCFWLALKEAVENKFMTKVNVLSLDESLHGLSPRLKAQAFDLVNKLSLRHSPLLVIDHNESFQSCFENVINVISSQGISSLA